MFFFSFYFKISFPLNTYLKIFVAGISESRKEGLGDGGQSRRQKKKKKV